MHGGCCLGDVWGYGCGEFTYVVQDLTTQRKPGEEAWAEQHGA